MNKTYFDFNINEVAYNRFDFHNLYEAQRMYQKNIYDGELEVPNDNSLAFSKNCLMLIEELGEMLHVDKRWKDIRKDKFILDEKKKELADVFIVCINIALHSGIEYNELYDIIKQKIQENERRMN